MSDELDFSVQLARHTGELLSKYFRRTGLNFRLKEDKSVVTEADLAADQWIAGEIRKYLPEDVLLSEELQTSTPASLKGRALWIIDPLDGTANFSLGLQIWGVLITRLVDGWPQLGALYFPMLEELYTVQLGKGAFLNGERIHVMPPDPSRPLPFFSCCSRTFRRYNVSIPYKARILGSAAYSFCALARGIAVVSFEVTPKIWDIAAAWLLVMEAGGVMDVYDGPAPFPIVPGHDYAHQSYASLGATSPGALAKARQQIQPK